jgi:hypothetical protein
VLSNWNSSNGALSISERSTVFVVQFGIWLVVHAQNETSASSLTYMPFVSLNILYVIVNLITFLSHLIIYFFPWIIVLELIRLISISDGNFFFSGSSCIGMISGFYVYIEKMVRV